MKNRPPLRTNEIHAYNFGARARRAGVDLSLVLPLDNLPGVVPLEPPELEALAAMGPDSFEKWTVKGWVESPQPDGLR